MFTRCDVLKSLPQFEYNLRNCHTFKHSVCNILYCKLYINRFNNIILPLVHYQVYIFRKVAGVTPVADAYHRCPCTKIKIVGVCLYCNQVSEPLYRYMPLFLNWYVSNIGIYALLFMLFRYITSMVNNCLFCWIEATRPSTSTKTETHF